MSKKLHIPITTNLEHPPKKPCISNSPVSKEQQQQQPSSSVPLLLKTNTDTHSRVHTSLPRKIAMLPVELARKHWRCSGSAKPSYYPLSQQQQQRCIRNPARRESCGRPRTITSALLHPRLFSASRLPHRRGCCRDGLRKNFSREKSPFRSWGRWIGDLLEVVYKGFGSFGGMELENAVVSRTFILFVIVFFIFAMFLWFTCDFFLPLAKYKKL